MDTELRRLSKGSRPRSGRSTGVVAGAFVVAVACGGGGGDGGTVIGAGGADTGGTGGSGEGGTGALLGVGGTGTGAGTAVGGTAGVGGAGPGPGGAGGAGGAGGGGGSGGCTDDACKAEFGPDFCCTGVGICALADATGCPDLNLGGSGAYGPVDHLCNAAAPPGAERAALPKPYSGGACPPLQQGRNTIVSSGSQRQFALQIPQDLDPAEQLPVVFLWHPLGLDGLAMLAGSDAIRATSQLRFLAVFPDDKEDLPFKWPYEIVAAEPRVQEELQFFDDMLACVSQQFNVQKECVASGGMSAGALWTAQLASYRSEYLSAIVSMSGGVGGVVRPFGNPIHKMPAVVAWGGPGDSCILDFNGTSIALGDALTAGGHFMIECIHNCNHSQPPLDPPAGTTAFAAFWQFVFDHPYWLAPGDSPYLQSGLPALWPYWCTIGRGASIRTDPCAIPTQCI